MADKTNEELLNEILGGSASSAVESDAMKSRYATYFQLNKQYSDGDGKIYSENLPGGFNGMGASRFSYGTVKAYQQRQKFENELYKIGASQEDVALMRSINENYETIGENPAILYSPEFIGNSLNNYYIDELAYNEFNIGNALVNSGTSAGFQRFIENTASKLKTEEDAEKLWEDIQKNPIQKRELEMAGLNEKDDFMGALGQFKIEHEMNQKSGTGNFVEDLSRNFLSAVWSSYSDMMITLYDGLPTAWEAIAGESNTPDLLKDWAASGMHLRNTAEKGSDLLSGDAKYAQHDGAAGHIYDFSSVLGSVTGISLSFVSLGGVGGLVGKATGSASKVAIGAGKSTKSISAMSKAYRVATGGTGKVLSSSWIAAQQAGSVYRGAKEENYNESDLRRMYATTVVGNMILLRATGAVPGAEMTGGVPYKSWAFAKQFTMAFIKEGFEENWQQGIEKNVKKFGKEDGYNNAKLLGDVLKNVDAKTFIMSGLSSGATGTVSSVKRNVVNTNVINKLRGKGITSVDTISEQVKNYPELYGYEKGAKVSQLQINDQVLLTLMRDAGAKSQKQVLGLYADETMNADLQRVFESGKIIGENVDTTLGLFEDDMKEQYENLGKKYDKQQAFSIMLNNGIISLDGQILKDGGFVSGDEFKVMIGLDNNVDMINEYWQLDDNQRSALNNLNSNEMIRVIKQLKDGTLKKEDLDAIANVKIESIKKENTIDIFYHNDLTIRYWNNLYGDKNAISQSDYQKIKDNYNDEIIKIKNDLNSGKQISKINLTGEQINALELISDGVTLETNEMVNLHNQGFKSSDIKVVDSIDIANKLIGFQDDFNNNKLNIEEFKNSVDEINGRIKDGSLNIDNIKKYNQVPDSMKMLDVVNIEEMIADKEFSEEAIERIKIDLEISRSDLARIQETTNKYRDDLKAEKILKENALLQNQVSEMLKPVEGKKDMLFLKEFENSFIPEINDLQKLVDKTENELKKEPVINIETKKDIVKEVIETEQETNKTELKIEESKFTKEDIDLGKRFNKSKISKVDLLYEIAKNEEKDKSYASTRRKETVSESEKEIRKKEAKIEDLLIEKNILKTIKVNNIILDTSIKSAPKIELFKLYEKINQFNKDGIDNFETLEQIKKRIDDNTFYQIKDSNNNIVYESKDFKDLFDYSVEMGLLDNNNIWYDDFKKQMKEQGYKVENNFISYLPNETKKVKVAPTKSKTVKNNLINSITSDTQIKDVINKENNNDMQELNFKINSGNEIMYKININDDDVRITDKGMVLPKYHSDPLIDIVVGNYLYDYETGDTYFSPSNPSSKKGKMKSTPKIVKEVLADVKENNPDLFSELENKVISQTTEFETGDIMNADDIDYIKSQDEKIRVVEESYFNPNADMIYIEDEFNPFVVKMDPKSKYALYDTESNIIINEYNNMKDVRDYLKGNIEGNYYDGDLWDIGFHIIKNDSYNKKSKKVLDTQNEFKKPKFDLTKLEEIILEEVTENRDEFNKQLENKVNEIKIEKSKNTKNITEKNISLKNKILEVKNGIIETKQNLLNKFETDGDIDGFISEITFENTEIDEFSFESRNALVITKPDIINIGNKNENVTLRAEFYPIKNSITFFDNSKGNRTQKTFSLVENGLMTENQAKSFFNNIMSWKYSLDIPVNIGKNKNIKVGQILSLKLNDLDGSQKLHYEGQMSIVKKLHEISLARDAQEVEAIKVMRPNKLRKNIQENKYLSPELVEEMTGEKFNKKVEEVKEKSYKDEICK